MENSGLFWSEADISHARNSIIEKVHGRRACFEHHVVVEMS